MSSTLIDYPMSPDETYATTEGVVLPPLIYTARPKWAPLAFLPAIFLCGMSWASGGVPSITDAGFAFLALACVIFLLEDFSNFARRFGIGGFVLYGGVLIWFCHDYFSNWFGISFTNAPLPPVVIAKAAYLYSIFIMMMAIGLLLPAGRRIENAINYVPDFESSSMMFTLVLIVFAIGISPYFWDVQEPFYEAIAKSITAGRSGSGPHFFYGRSSNIATSWGSYIGHIIDLGSVAGLLAVAYALFKARSPLTRAVAWSIWGLQTALCFGSGSRGQLLFEMLPVVGLLFVKYQAIAASLSKRFSVRAYVILATLGIIMFAGAQIAVTFRNTGYSGADLGQVNYTKAQGNLMFSEGLKGYALIPEHHRVFYDDFPGETIIRPLPESLFLGLSHPIPRVIWPSKPIDALSIWYANIITGEDSKGGTTGTTISHGLVGYFYFKYGLSGVIQGGLLMGWLMGLSEKWLRASDGRLLPMLTSLGFSTWVFRCYRDLTFGELWTFLLGILLISLLLVLIRPFTARN